MKNLFTPTHSQLVERAARYLRNNEKCHVVFTEMVMGYFDEIPDAIGFNLEGCTALIECKTNKADFRNDNKKHFRFNKGSGMGMRRYYMCPPGVIQPEDLPYQWGLIWVTPKRCQVVVQPTIMENNVRAEMGMLVSMAYRISKVTPQHFKNGLFSNLTFKMQEEMEKEIKDDHHAAHYEENFSDKVDDREQH